MTTFLECVAASSDQVLQAARAAMPSSPAEFLQPHALRQLSTKQAPLVALLMALLDSAQSTAQAIADNAWDDGQPLTSDLTAELAEQCRALTSAISNAAAAHDTSGWSLLSMTGKELV